MLQHDLFETESSHQPLELVFLLFQLIHLAQLARPQFAVLLTPFVKSGSTDPHLVADIFNLCTHLRPLQRLRNLLPRQSALRPRISRIHKVNHAEISTFDVSGYVSLRRRNHESVFLTWQRSDKKCHRPTP